MKNDLINYSLHFFNIHKNFTNFYKYFYNKIVIFEFIMLNNILKIKDEFYFFEFKSLKIALDTELDFYDYNFELYKYSFLRKFINKLKKIYKNYIK